MSKQRANTIKISGRYDVRYIATALRWLDSKGDVAKFATQIIKDLLVSLFYSLPDNERITSISEAWDMLDSKGVLQGRRSVVQSNIFKSKVAQPLTNVESIVEETIKKLEKGEKE